MQPFQPASTLPTDIIDEAGDRLEFVEARERGNVLRQLHAELEIIDRDHEFAHQLELAAAIAPGAVGAAKNRRRLIAQIRADAVLVSACASDPGDFDRRAQTRGCLGNGG